MKKINLVIAMFAVAAAASTAAVKATEVNFDGNNGTNITVASFAQVEQGEVPLPVFPSNENMVPDSVTGRTCCGYPIGPFDACIMTCTWDNNSWKAAPTPESFKGLARYYAAQGKIKKAAAEHFTARNQLGMAAAFSAKEARVAAEKGAVYLVASGKAVKVDDAELAGAIIEIVRPQPQTRFIDPLTGAIIIVGCMEDDACWGAVGDGVSAVSEWLNS